MSDQQQRFGGIERLYGRQAMSGLSGKHVAVVGIGGVGSWAAEALARSGVGTITLIDLDDICVTNINRQIHALSSTVGQQKVTVMAERIRDINPGCTVHAIEDFLAEDNMAALIDDDIDGVIDAIDNAGMKAQLIVHCKKRKKIPIVTTGAAGGQLDPTKIDVVDLCRTYNDPLAAKVRSILRRHYGFSRNPKRHFSVPCVFSHEQLRYPKSDGTTCQAKSEKTPDAYAMDCSGGFGATTLVTATYGFVAVSRLLKRWFE